MYGKFMFLAILLSFFKMPLYDEFLFRVQAPNILLKELEIVM